MSHGQHPLLSLLFGVLILAWFLLASVPSHRPIHVSATLSPPAFYQLTHSHPSDLHSLFFLISRKSLLIHLSELGLRTLLFFFNRPYNISYFFLYLSFSEVLKFFKDRVHQGFNSSLNSCCLPLVNGTC